MVKVKLKKIYIWKTAFCFALITLMMVFIYGAIYLTFFMVSVYPVAKEIDFATNSNLMLSSTSAKINPFILLSSLFIKIIKKGVSMIIPFFLAVLPLVSFIIIFVFSVIAFALYNYVIRYIVEVTLDLEEEIMEARPQIMEQKQISPINPYPPLTPSYQYTPTYQEPTSVSTEPPSSLSSTGIVPM